MERYKLLKDCKNGEWVYYGPGKLYQVRKFINSIDNREYSNLVDGYFEIGVGGNTKVYPIDIHTKVIAEAIHYYYDDMCKKRLINGSKWVNWLGEKFDELMALEEDTPSEKYEEIYRKMEEQISTLMYHKSFL